MLLQISLLLSLILVLNSCGGEEKACCPRPGVITLDFSSLPSNPLPALFSLDKVTCIRIYDEIKHLGNSLLCQGREEVPPGSGYWKDAALMLIFSQLPCNACSIITEVDGHGSEARIVATQQDGSTQTAVCPGGKQVLTLQADRDNPFTWIILSGQEAEWTKFRVE